MNAREKTLFGIVGACLGIVVVGFGLRAFVTKPLKEADKRIAGIREKIAKAQEERRNFFDAEDRLKRYGQKAFGDAVDQASAVSGELITKQIIAAGLDEVDFTRLPVGLRKLRGATEIGWNVQGQGKLTNLVNLLFVLSQSPYMHRVDGLSVAPGDAPGLVRARFRFLTVVLEPPPDIKRVPLVTEISLTSTQRLALEPILSRDLLRPYIKRPPAPAVAETGGTKTGPGEKAKVHGPESLRVVSLSEWNGQPEVHVRDLVNEKTIRYKPGDEFLGGKIAMIDYRPLPWPGKEPLQSFSRVIVQIGADYWAIERGGTLAEKRKLATADLPRELAKPGE